MRAEYDSRADALSIDLVDRPSADHAEEIDARCNVAVDGTGSPVSVEVRGPGDGLHAALTAVSVRFGLDVDALEAAARAALAVPDREVLLEVRAKAAA